MDTMRKAALPRDLKSHNYREALRVIGTEKQFTIAHLSESTDISRQTITKAIEYFLREEVIILSKKGESTKVGGRKSQEYMLNTEKYIITVSSYSRKTRFSLLNFSYELIDSFDCVLALDATYKEFLNAVKVYTGKLLEKNNIAEKDFYGIMVCTGGIIDSKSGKIKVSSVCSDWGRDIPIKEDVKKFFDRDIQVCVGNVAATSASVLSMNKETVGKRVAVLYLDYGVGVTFLEDGKIPETAHNVSGEMGHMVINMDSNKACDCGDSGCLEALVYESNIRKMAQELPEERRKLLLDGYDEREDFRIHILRKCDAGNADAKEITNYLANIFGTAMRNIVFSFDPDIFVLMGSFSDWSNYFKEEILRVIRKNKYLSDLDIPIWRLSENIEEIMDKGSVSIMLQSFLDCNE